MQIKKNVKENANQCKTSRTTSILDKKKPIKFKNIYLNYQINTEDNLVILNNKYEFKAKNKDENVHTLKQLNKKDNDFLSNEKELLVKRKEKTNEYRINKIIKEKCSFIKGPIPKTKNNLILTNITNKKYIRIGKMIESEIDFRKKHLKINQISEKRITKADIFCNELINNKSLTRNRSNDTNNLNPLPELSINALIKKKLHFAAKIIYECIVTNNPLILTNFKSSINHNIDKYLLYVIDKVYKLCYSFKDNLNTDLIKSLLLKEFKIVNTLSTTVKNFSSSKYSQTIAPLDSYNESYTYRKNFDSNNQQLTKLFPSNSKISRILKTNNPSNILFDSLYDKQLTIEGEQIIPLIDFNSSYFSNNNYNTTSDKNIDTLKDILSGDLRTQENINSTSITNAFQRIMKENNPDFSDYTTRKHSVRTSPNPLGNHTKFKSSFKRYDTYSLEREKEESNQHGKTKVNGLSITKNKNFRKSNKNSIYHD